MAVLLGGGGMREGQKSECGLWEPRGGERGASGVLPGTRQETGSKRQAGSRLSPGGAREARERR